MSSNTIQQVGFGFETDGAFDIRFYVEPVDGPCTEADAKLAVTRAAPTTHKGMSLVEVSVKADKDHDGKWFGYATYRTPTDTTPEPTPE